MMTKQNRIVLLFLLLLAIGNIPAIAADYLLNISANRNETIRVYQMNGVAIPNEGSVTAGDTYRVIATCSDENYLFDHLEVTGGNNIVVEDKEKGQCTFVVSGTGSVTVKAVFIGKPQTIELKAPEAGQGTYCVICNGRKIQDKGTVPYGSAVTVIAEPKEGFLLENIFIDNTPVPVFNNQYVVGEVKDRTSITVTYKDIKPIVRFNTSTILKVLVNVDNEPLISGQAVPFGTKVRIVVESAYGKICLLRINNKFPILKQEDVNKFSCDWIVKEDIVIEKLREQSKPYPTLYSSSPNVTFEYDGKPKQFSDYRCIPIGFDNLIVKYKKKGDKEFVGANPIEVGIYDVEISRDEDNYFKKPNSKLKAVLTIKPAVVSIQTLPHIAFENNIPILKDGSATSNGKRIEGCFEFLSVPTGNVLSEIIFTPKDIVHYQKAKCILPVIFDGNIETFKINIASLPSGILLQVKNGDAVVNSGDMVAKGTKLNLSVIGLPENMEVKEFINQTSLTSYELIGNVIDCDIDYNLSILLKEKDALPEIVLEKNTDKKAFIGISQIFSTSNIGIGNLTTNHWIVTYTDTEKNQQVTAPLNVGEYKMDLYYPSDGKYASFRGEGTFIITEGEPNAVFTNIKTSSVAEGQPLSFSSITGGVADVPGTFTWMDPSQKVYNGKEYEIVFTPTDPNYKKMSAKMKVPVTTVPFLSFAPKNGTIHVVNKATNQILKSGDWLSVGDELVIKAQPSSGYSLQMLSVNGYLISNGSSYFVGDKPLNIEAAFEDSSVPSSPYYTVTIPEVTGAIISNTGTNRVKEGNSFSFVIDYDLLYGAPTVTAGGQKLAFDGSYTYTLTKVTQDTTVSISLPKFGHYMITTSVDTTLAEIDVKAIDAAMKAGTEGYAYGTELELTVIPVDGVRFYSWWDGNAENPRIYKVRSNQKISANFRGTPTGIDNVAKALDIRSFGNNLHIQTDTECKARIIDMQGRMINQFMVSGSATYQVSQPGVYIVILYKDDQLVLTRKIKIYQ